MTTADLPSLGEIEAGDKTFQAMRVLARELLALRDRVERCDEWSVQHGQMIDGQNNRLTALERVQRDAETGEREAAKVHVALADGDRDRWKQAAAAEADLADEFKRERDEAICQRELARDGMCRERQLAHDAIHERDALREEIRWVISLYTDVPNPIKDRLAAALASATPAEGGSDA